MRSPTSRASPTPLFVRFDVEGKVQRLTVTKECSSPDMLACLVALISSSEVAPFWSDLGRC